MEVRLTQWKPSGQAAINNLLDLKKVQIGRGTGTHKGRKHRFLLSLHCYGSLTKRSPSGFIEAEDSTPTSSNQCTASRVTSAPLLHVLYSLSRGRSNEEDTHPYLCIVCLDRGSHLSRVHALCGLRLSGMHASFIFISSTISFLKSQYENIMQC